MRPYAQAADVSTSEAVLRLRHSVAKVAFGVSWPEGSQQY